MMRGEGLEGRMSNSITLDEYIKKAKGSLVVAAREQVEGFDLQNLYIMQRFIIQQHGESLDCYLNTMPLGSFLNAIDTLQSLTTQSTITEENVSKALKTLGIQMSTARIRYAIEAGMRDVEQESDRTLEPQEIVNITLDRVITKLLSIGDNYLTYVFLPEGTTYEDFCKEVRANLPERMTMKTTVREEQDGKVRYYSLAYNEDVPVAQQFRVFQGTGAISQYASLPKNQIHIRWHGLAMATTPMIKIIAKLVQEKGYEAHFNVEQCGNVLGGAFFKPK